MVKNIFLRCCPALLASDLTSGYADSVEDKRVVAVNDKPFAGVRELIHRLDLALENDQLIACPAGGTSVAG